MQCKNIETGKAQKNFSSGNGNRIVRTAEELLSKLHLFSKLS